MNPRLRGVRARQDHVGRTAVRHAGGQHSECGAAIDREEDVDRSGDIAATNTPGDRNAAT